MRHARELASAVHYTPYWPTPTGAYTRLHSRRQARSLQPTMGATTARQLKGSGFLPPRQRRLDGRSARSSAPLEEEAMLPSAEADERETCMPTRRAWSIIFAARRGS